MTRDLFLKSILIVLTLTWFVFTTPRTLFFLSDHFQIPGTSGLAQRLRQQYLNRWLTTELHNQSLQAESQLDLPALWQLRDEYSLGYFTYNQEIFRPYSILEFEEVPTSHNQLFTFENNFLQSREWLSFVETATQSAKPVPEEITWTNGRDIIWETACHSHRCIHVRTVRSLDEMKQYQGLINFSHSQVVLRPKLWWWITETRFEIE